MTGTMTRFDMEVSGLKELVAGLRTMQGPELVKTIEDSASRTIRGVAVPAMKRQMAADFKNLGSHKEPRRKDGSGERSKPKPGRQGPAERNVRIRRLRKRGNEIVAIAAGPRAWYAHYPIGGTRPHVIAASGLGGVATSSIVRSMNRDYTGKRLITKDGQLTRSGRALLIGNLYATRVQHPGSTGTNSIQKAIRGIEPQMNARYATDLQKAYDRRIAGPTRRAKKR